MCQEAAEWWMQAFGLLNCGFGTYPRLEKETAIKEKAEIAAKEAQEKNEAFQAALNGLWTRHEANSFTA